MKFVAKLCFFLALFVYSGCSYLDIHDSPHLNRLSSDDISPVIIDSSLFYYSSGKKVYLTERKDLLLVCFSDARAKSTGLSSIEKDLQFTSWTSVNQSQSITDDSNSSIAVIKSNKGRFSDNDVSKILDRADVIHSSYLVEKNGNYYAPANQFMVKVKMKSDSELLEEWVRKNSCVIIDKPWLGEDVYLVSVPKTHDKTAIELANELSESGQFIFSLPDFYLFDSFLSNDPYYNLQWGLWDRKVSTQANTTSLQTAWAITEGNENIKIAVIDTGVELNHPDLQGQLVDGFDAANNLSAGGPAGLITYLPHGTCVAGIIVAKKDNNIGMSGVAPGCKVIPININGPQGLVVSSIRSAVEWALAHDADVINFSVKFIEGYIDDLLIRATTEGRNGKGCVVVAASGNDEVENVSYPASFSSVLAVGAHSSDGLRSDFSNYGIGLNVVAPGFLIVTTDLLGTDGYNSNTSSDEVSDRNYTKLFKGTSAAAPFASGIAALILSKYPDLSEAQVRRAIELGSDRHYAYSFQYDTQYPPGLWNNQVGYGMVNAYSALLKAEGYHQDNIANSIPGIDFEVVNESSYSISNIYVSLSGKITGYDTDFFAAEVGSLDSYEMVGFPIYRGEDISESPGSLITDLELEVYAETPDYSGNLRISATFGSPSSFDLCCFDTGATHYLSVPDTTVPNASRRKLRIHITNPLN